MSTLNVTQIKNPDAASPALTLNTDGSVDIAISALSSGPLAGFRNAIINGNFDFWIRGTSGFTTAGYGADRWKWNRLGSTFSGSRQAFTLGQADVPGEPTYYIRTVVTSVTGASNTVFLEQPIEGVRTYAGQSITVSFYAKADASKSLAIELYQTFGSGGTASTFVTADATKVSLTTAWTKYTVTATLPSISGKTLDGGDDYLSLRFYFDAGSSYNARTDTLGHQSGTFDIAQVQLEPGYIATIFERRHPGVELALCQRYYYKSEDTNGFLFRASQGGPLGRNLTGPIHHFPTTMRDVPNIAYTDAVGNANRWTVGSSNNIAIASGSVTVNPSFVRADIGFGSIGQDYAAAAAHNFTASAEL